MAFKLRRRPAKASLRYFVYVSDAKLDMLFDQIPPELRQRISAEAKVDLKLASLTIKEAQTPTATRMAKLNVVERYIDRHQRVGTVQEPGSEYFRGTMPLRWGWFPDLNASRDSPNGGFNVAFFSGERDGHTVVLVGSRHHVLGEQPLSVSADVMTSSAFPTITMVVVKHVSDVYEKATKLDDLREHRMMEWEAEFHTRPEIVLQMVRMPRLGGPPRWMEFLAVPILEGDVALPILEGDVGDGPETHTVLATPIYVAHANPE
ncbi:MAG TPA: SAVMC3_10250 family protein [Mycobacterium sp.]|uniref:DUF7019 family protein n=1 Tax=Mycobacterium sp. TaxID=1785 RepID=UPI002C97D80A|nr:SAVMC3_10250 family protein [Mycobacterium sp.]HME78619.1 SAVMC3_10250 family protein [Mycobacterium sp.]